MKVITLRERSRRVAARKAALGGVPDERIAQARSQGNRRTPEKRALLEEIAAEGRRQRRKPPFISRF